MVGGEVATEGMSMAKGTCDGGVSAVSKGASRGTRRQRRGQQWEGCGEVFIFF